MDPNNTPSQPAPENPTPTIPTPVVSSGEAPEPQKNEGWHNVASTIIVLAVALLVAVGLSSFVFQSYEVSGPSMETTLNNNDRLIVWKLPRTWSKITGHAYIPHRGDIIIFDQTGLPDGEKQLIKRVVGLPGDRIVVQDGMLTVYNQAHPDGYQPDKTMPYGSVITDTEPETGQHEWVIGKDQVFVCGDNRPDSLDSRTFGPVSSKQIIGKLELRVAPFSDIKRF
ncbi:MAG TPA: signal peptidase I [Candidatus Saccharimonadales bacterium]|nr:signal peptidase I [Candidatus Saccharimonadales bacterium]